VAGIERGDRRSGYIGDVSPLAAPPTTVRHVTTSHRRPHGERSVATWHAAAAQAIALTLWSSSEYRWQTSPNSRESRRSTQAYIVAANAKAAAERAKAKAKAAAEAAEAQARLQAKKQIIKAAKAEVKLFVTR
jgi:hypothetical protein